MRKLIAVAALTLAAPLAAKDSLGVFSDWGAFRDPSLPRCYAIAMPEDSRARRDFEPFATVGTWPRRNLRGQLHFRLSRQLAAGSAITLAIGGNRLLHLRGDLHDRGGTGGAHRSLVPRHGGRILDLV